jgi:hypothetical protein
MGNVVVLEQAPAQGTDHGVAGHRRSGEEENMKRVIGLT